MFEKSLYTALGMVVGCLVAAVMAMTVVIFVAAWRMVAGG